MEFIKFLLKISWKHIVIIIIAGLISGSLNALLIGLINQQVHNGYLPNALFYFALLAVFVVITGVVSQFMLVYLCQNTIYQLRLKLSENILTSPLQHLEILKENRLIVSFSEDVHVLTLAISTIPNICIDLATVIGCFIYLAYFSWVLFVFSLASTSIAIWFVQTKLNKAQHLFFQARHEEDNLLKHFQGIIQGIKELKLNRDKRYEFLDTNMRSSAQKLRRRNTQAMNSFVFANGFGLMSQFTSLGLVLFILPLFWEFTRPLLGTYILINTFMALPIHNLLNRIPELIKGNIALQKIQRMKLSLSNFAEFDEKPASISQQCELKLKEVCYLYPAYAIEDNFEGTLSPANLGIHPQGFHPDHPPLPPPDAPHPWGKGHPPAPPELHTHDSKLPPPHLQHKGRLGPPPLRFREKGFQLGPLSLTLKPGELVFVIGGNGSGKSTLAKIITGLYEPQSGEIYLNKTPITQNNLEWYRQHFTAIFSDFYLFESCLGFNDPNLDEKINAYLRKLQLAHKVQAKDGVLSTISLSFGQRKRLALLSAYLEDRPIYLFDEWASDQEPEFRELFYKQILTELKEQGKIVIVITHDDRYFHLADHLIKLDYGKIQFERTSEPIA
jgi:putative ATP-binding cassette transporter